MVISLVSSEQVVKPHSRLVVVKPDVLHLSEISSLVQRAAKCTKMGVAFIKWAWLVIFVCMLAYNLRSF